MIFKSTLSLAAIATAGVLFSGSSQAAMSQAFSYKTADVQRVDCEVGFHVGPVGTCIESEEEHNEKIIEKRATDDGCKTKSVTRSDDMGNSETRTKTNCD